MSQCQPKGPAIRIEPIRKTRTVPSDGVRALHVLHGYSMTRLEARVGETARPEVGDQASGACETRPRQPSYFYFLLLVHALAGPHPLRFFAANLLGALCYVPWPALAGYSVGYGLGDWVEQLRGATGLKDDVALFAAIRPLAGVAFIATTWAHDRRAARPAGRTDPRDI